jgi:hypothetical protein
MQELQEVFQEKFQEGLLLDTDAHAHKETKTHANPDLFTNFASERSLHQQR